MRISCVLPNLKIPVIAFPPKAKVHVLCWFSCAEWDEEQSPQLKGIEMEVSTFHLELYAADCAMANPAVNAARGCAAVRVPPNRGKGCSLRLSLSHRQSWQEKPTHSSQCSGYWCTLGLTWPGFETHL